MSGLRALAVSAAVAVVFPASAQSDPFPVNRQPGTLVYWFTGTGTFPQSAMPYGRFTKVDGRWIRLIALREDGAALSWRAESWGGTSVDFNLRSGPYRDVKISGNMLLLRKPDNTWDAFFPPNEGGAPFNPPIPPLAFANADCAVYYGAGLDFDGEIWAWGWNNVGQSDCPPGPFIDVACLDMTTAGLRPDGTVQLWGQHAGVIDAPDVMRIKSGVDSLYGQTTSGEIVCLRACNSSWLPGEPVWDFDPRDGDSGLVWITRDGRGFMSPGTVPETRWQDITTTVGGGEALGVIDTDCDGSGFFDSSEIAAGVVGDCNDNRVPDACETGRSIVRRVQWSGDLLSGQPVQLSVDRLRASWRGVRVDVESRGDLLGASRFVTMRVGDMKTEWDLFSSTGRACWQPGRAWDAVEFTSGEFESVRNGSNSIVLEFTPSAAVNTRNCVDGGLWVRVEFVADAPFDCNGNGQDDACDLVQAISMDVNCNGIPDECEGGVPGDITADGRIDGADLSALLGSWGTSNPDADVDGSGWVDGTDLALVLGNWCDSSG